MAKENTKQKIIDAAIKVFSVYGYLGARTITIATEANVTRTSLHYHFKSKAILFQAVMEEVVSIAQDRVQKSLQGKSMDTANLVNNVIDVHFDLFGHHDHIAKFMTMLVMQSPEVLYNSSYGKSDIMPALLQEVINLARKSNPDISPDLNGEQLTLHIIGLSIFPYLAKEYSNLQQNRTEAAFEKFMLERKELTKETIHRLLFATNQDITN